MNPNRRFLAIALSALLALSIVAPGLALADTDQTAGNLGINVAQNGEIAVTVTDDTATVENATVNVTVDDENVTYEAAGTYVTDENGTVGLSVPEETVNVTISATYENRTADKRVTLAAETEDDDAQDVPFGQRVSAFLQALFGASDDDRSVGERVAGFVTSNNPGNPPAHAGPGSVNDSDTLNDSNGTDDGDTEGDIETTDGSPTDRGNSGGPPVEGSDHSSAGSERGGNSANGGGNAGSAGNAPGNSGASPGNGGNSPGHGGGSPGNSGNAPGR